MVDKKIGHYAFLVAVLLGVVAALVPALQVNWVTWALIILGLIVGFLNITAKETTEFLVAAIALMLVGTAGLGAVPTAGQIITSILRNLITVVAPAALIVALKAVYELAEE